MKVMHKVGIHRTRVDDEGNISLKYSSSPDFVLELDKGETATVMDMFTKNGFAVVVFPEVTELHSEKEYLDRIKVLEATVQELREINEEYAYGERGQDQEENAEDDE